MTPFNRAHMTIASRRTIPTYPPFCIIVGGSWALNVGGRLGDSAGLRFAGNGTPVMGFVVMMIGLWLGVVAILGELDTSQRFDYRSAYVKGLGALMFWMYAWALVLLFACIFGHATVSAFAWPAAIGRFCWASMVSLDSREV